MSRSLPITPASKPLSDAEQNSVLREQLAIARQAFALIQDDASRPPHKVRQEMCGTLARRAVARIDQIGRDSVSSVAPQLERQS